MEMMENIRIREENWLWGSQNADIFFFIRRRQYKTFFPPQTQISWKKTKHRVSHNRKCLFFLIIIIRHNRAEIIENTKKVEIQLLRTKREKCETNDIEFQSVAYAKSKVYDILAILYRKIGGKSVCFHVEMHKFVKVFGYT